MPASDRATATLTLAGKPAMASRALPSNTRSGSFEPVHRDAALDQQRRAGQTGRRLARDDLDRGDRALGGGAHGIEAEQRAGGHDDARAGLPRAIDEVHVVDEHADGQRHEDAAAFDGRRGDGGELRRRQALDDDVGGLGEGGEIHERAAATGSLPSRAAPWPDRARQRRRAGCRVRVPHRRRARRRGRWRPVRRCRAAGLSGRQPFQFTLETASA